MISLPACLGALNEFVFTFYNNSTYLFSMLQCLLTEADAPAAQANDEDIDVEAPMKSADVRQGQGCYL